MSVSAPLADIWGVTKSRTLQGNSVCRRNRHWCAVVPNAVASSTAVRETHMQSAVGIIKRLFAVELRPANKNRQIEFNWLSLVVNEIRIVVFEEHHHPAGRSARFYACDCFALQY